MVNASWVRPDGRIRPFGMAGARHHAGRRLRLAVQPRRRRTYDFGLNVGGGVFAVLNDIVGVRGDVRYFFASADHPDLARPDNFGFWRISFGATFMWAIAP